MRLMTLNLWCYFDWDNRVQSLIELISEQRPDIIAFQEVEINTTFKDKPSSSLIVEDDIYPYQIYEEAWNSKKLNYWDENIESRESHGLAIISKFPIISSEVHKLKQHKDHDEPCIVLFCKIKTDRGEIDLCNVNFGNSDLFSDLHIKELMELCDKRNIKPIILGDFNNFNLSQYKNDILKDYVISTEISNYISMPKDKGTLDYIVCPDQFKIENVICPEVYVSDHRPVLADIDITSSANI